MGIPRKSAMSPQPAAANARQRLIIRLEALIPYARKRAGAQRRSGRANRRQHPRVRLYDPGPGGRIPRRRSRKSPAACGVRRPIGFNSSSSQPAFSANLLSAMIPRPARRGRGRQREFPLNPHLRAECLSSDPVYFDSRYYVYPDGPIAVEALQVIGAAMAEAGVVGLGRLTLSRRERMVMAEPRGTGMALFTLRAAAEVRAPQFGSAEGDLDAEMVAIAGAIVRQRTGNFDPSTYRLGRRRGLVLQTPFSLQLPVFSSCARWSCAAPLGIS
jgi:hypothetical protein